jgi:hypothetical protein
VRNRVVVAGMRQGVCVCVLVYVCGCMCVGRERGRRSAKHTKAQQWQFCCGMEPAASNKRCATHKMRTFISRLLSRWSRKNPVFWPCIPPTTHDSSTHSAVNAPSPAAHTPAAKLATRSVLQCCLCTRSCTNSNIPFQARAPTTHLHNIRGKAHAVLLELHRRSRLAAQ